MHGKWTATKGMRLHPDLIAEQAANEFTGPKFGGIGAMFAYRKEPVVEVFHELMAREELIEWFSVNGVKAVPWAEAADPVMLFAAIVSVNKAPEWMLDEAERAGRDLAIEHAVKFFKHIVDDAVFYVFTDNIAAAMREIS